MPADGAACQDVLHQLYECYEFAPADVEFMLPQVCNFLLHGAFHKSTQLECFMLDKCER